jgi:hypothetical protein
MGEMCRHDTHFPIRTDGGPPVFSEIVSLERKTSAQFDSACVFRGDRRSNRRGGEHGIHTCNIRVIQQIRAPGIQAERARVILVLWIERERATQIRIKMHQGRHSSQVPGDGPVDSIRC